MRIARILGRGYVRASSIVLLGLCILSSTYFTASAQSSSGSVGAKKNTLSTKESKAKVHRELELARKYRASLTPEKIKRQQNGPILVLKPVHQDVSGPLDELIKNKRSFPTEAPRPMKNGRREVPEVEDPFKFSPGPLVESFLQTSTPLAPEADPGVSFESLGGGTPGYTITSIPPDETMAVGPNHIVAWVNSHFAIYNKTGTPQLPAPGFAAGNTLWAGFGGVCETTNRGDPIVQYDRLADRWVFSQFAFSVDGSGNPILPYLQCFAVTTGPNPAGPYNRYSYSFATASPTAGPAFNDYGKIGIWNDGYYVAYNMFGGSPAGGFVGVGLCAYDKSLMLSGGVATSVCAPTAFYAGGGSFLPADMEGPTLPTDTTRGGLFMRQSTAPALRFLRLKPDFAVPANTTITNGFGGAAGSFVNLPSPQVRACNGSGGTCIPQPGTGNQLDTLGDRLMYRLSYRNRFGVDSLVVSMAADPDGAGTQSAAMRWWEIRNPLNDPAGPNPPFIYQDSTFNPDATNRWMGSAAMNAYGDIMMSYNISSGTVSPGVAVAGRRLTDPLNTLQAEQIAINGGGSQTGYSRWGDYSTIQVDPSDDRTFWFISEYYSATSAFTWRTRIFSYSFPVPTAAGVRVSGRVTTSEGFGLSNALVKMTDSKGTVRTARTGSFGYFHFDDVPTGETFIVAVDSKRYRFEPRIVTVTDELSDLDFVPISNSK